MRGRRIIIRNLPVEDYVLEIIAEFHRGSTSLTLYAVGRDICKLADVVAELGQRMGEGFRISGWNIGSKKIKGERQSFLEITLEYVV